jgi:hypothetical protein
VKDQSCRQGGRRGGTACRLDRLSGGSRSTRIVRKIAVGLLVTLVLAVGAFLAVVLFVALVDMSSSGPDEPSTTDDGVYEDYLNEQGRRATEEEERLRCEEAREEIPDLTC